MKKSLGGDGGKMAEPSQQQYGENVNRPPVVGEDGKQETVRVRDACSKYV